MNRLNMISLIDSVKKLIEDGSQVFFEDMG